MKKTVWFKFDSKYAIKSILKKIGQIFIIFAHSVGCNVPKIIRCSISNHYEPKYLYKSVKNDEILD